MAGLDVDGYFDISQRSEADYMSASGTKPTSVARLRASSYGCKTVVTHPPCGVCSLRFWEGDMFQTRPERGVSMA